jgi:hypothetical protein
VSFGTIVMDEYWSLCRTDVKGTLSLLADALGGQCDTLVLIATGSNKAVQREVRCTYTPSRRRPHPTALHCQCSSLSTPSVHLTAVSHVGAGAVYARGVLGPAARQLSAA